MTEAVPDREGGDSQKEDDLGGKDDKVLPGAVGVAALQLLGQ